jgi:hypothetical protein
MGLCTLRCEDEDEKDFRKMLKMFSLTLPSPQGEGEGQRMRMRMRRKKQKYGYNITKMQRVRGGE